MEENNFSKSIFIKSIILTVLVTAVVASMVTMIVMNNNESSSLLDKISTKLASIEQIVDKDYLGEIDENKIFDETMKGYVDGLDDEYSQYFTKEELEEYKTDNIEGQFVGIGVYIVQDTEKNAIRVLAPIKGSPAETAGILAGDYIVQVDGVTYTGEQITEATNKMKGQEGTTVKIQVLRGEETLDFEVERKNVRVNPIESNVYDNNIGYIYISQFDDVTTDQFKEAVNDLQNQGVAGLVIDIRNNPGGVLKTVVDMLDYILPNGLIVYTETKDGTRQEYSGSDNHELNLPMAVLVNGNSASASEIFAGAMQDYDKAQIIGTQTFGKGIVQTIRPLTDGSAVKYTIAKYFTPKGQDIHGKGVTPDSIVELPDDATEDVQLKAAVEYLNGKMSVSAAE